MTSPHPTLQIRELSNVLSSVTKRKERRLTRLPPPERVKLHGEKELVRGEVTDLPRLQLALKKDVKAHARSFWDALRKAVDHKYGQTSLAFRIFSCSKDHVMSCQQFQELCESVGLTLEPRLQKTLFEMAMKREYDVAWSFQDFQETLLAPKIDRIRQRLNVYNYSVRRMHGHIDQFIKRLAIESGEDNRRLSVARLQKKLGLPFCVELRAGLQRYVTRIGKVECAIHAEDFAKVIDKAAVFQHYEHTLLRNMFERVDRLRCGSVSISDLIVAFTLLASECASPDDIRREKLQFLFDLFDTDGDGCLTGEEILRMYCSITIHAAIANGDQPSYDADMALGDELSLSKARRLYDFTLMFLQQSGIYDLCTFKELWSTFVQYPSVMQELIPSVYCNSIMWVLRPLRPLCAEEPAKRVNRRTESKLTLTKRSTLEGRSSKWNAAVGHALSNSSSSPTLDPADSTKQSLAAAAGKLRPTSRSKSVEVSRTERFRVQAAIRFRHALRGEWDVVNSLQSAPPQSRENWFDSSQIKLPALTLLPAHGSMSASASSSKHAHTVCWTCGKNGHKSKHCPVAAAAAASAAALKHANTLCWTCGQKGHKSKHCPTGPPAGENSQKLPHINYQWAEATSKWERRQREGNWQSSHRQSIVNWTKDSNGDGSPTPLARSIRKTRSEPTLKETVTALSAMSAEEVKQATDVRVAEITSDNAKGLEGSDLLTSPQRFGKQALIRIQNVAKARAAAGSDQNHNHHDDAPSPTDRQRYVCYLCNGRHELEVPCRY